ncbi:hypothetical protein Emed_006266 [Eimeria media]
MAAKLGQKEENEEEGSPFGLRVAGEIVALASAIHKEVLRAFARRIAVGAEFGKVFGGGSSTISVSSWLAERFTDFRRFIYPSYVLDAQFGCLQSSVEPLLADTRLQTGCTDDRGRPQPLIKCADPAEQFSKGMRKSIWESSLGGWLKKGKAHPACQQLLQQLEEDEAAWAQQVHLMFTHLDTPKDAFASKPTDPNLGSSARCRGSFSHAAADARPTLEQVMATFAAAPTASAEVLVRLPFYFPSRVVSSFSKGGPQALHMLDYTYTLMQPSYSRELGNKVSIRHLIDVTEDAEVWVARNIAACGNSACTAQQAGDHELSVSIENESAATATYTFPATREERAASSVFNWLLPGLPSLRCKLPVSVQQQPIIPVLLPPIVPPPMGAPTGAPTGEGGPPTPEGEEAAFPPTAEEAAEERAGGEQPAETPEQVQPTPPEKVPEEPIVIEKIPDKPDVTDPEELITAKPTEPEEGPQLDPKDDVCHELMRLYYKYIEGKTVKDTETLWEEASQISLFVKTRKELRLDEKDKTMQSFRLTLCVTCAKHIPAMQLASPEERKRLSASLEKSREACEEVYNKTGWVNEMEGGVPLTAATPAELASIFGSSTRVGDVLLSPTSMAGGLASWLPMSRGLTTWAQQARKKVKTDAAAAALCAALRFAEFLRQITKQGEGFDRTLNLWHLSLPNDSLRLVNALRTTARQKDVLSQDLCTLAPPSPQVQQLLTRFDPHQWAALAMQAATPEELPTAEEARSSEAESEADPNFARLKQQQQTMQMQQQRTELQLERTMREKILFEIAIQAVYIHQQLLQLLLQLLLL